MSEDDELTMDDLPAYDTPEMPDQEEAEYDGETVTLYDPWRLDNDEKNYAVYVRNPDSGNVNKLKFGSGDMEIKRDDPGRLKSFRERFSCNEYDQSDKHKATFWSCLFWRKDLPVSDILSENTVTITESQLRQTIRSVLTEAVVNHDSVLKDIQKFSLPRQGRSSGFGRSPAQPVRVRVDEMRGNIEFSVDFRYWGNWSAPIDSPRIGPEDRDFHTIDSDDYAEAKDAWFGFIDNYSWSHVATDAGVEEGEKQYLYCYVSFDPSDVEGFEGRNSKSLR